MMILVTGGAGFIGSHVAEAYARQGHRVVVLDNLSRARLLNASPRTAEFTWNILAKTPNITCVRGDVRDGALVGDLVREADAVVHTAGQTAVTTSLTDPVSDFETNVVGTFRLLEAARATGRPIPLVFTSTNKVYGENVNALGVREAGNRYVFTSGHEDGVPESLTGLLVDHYPIAAAHPACLRQQLLSTVRVIRQRRDGRFEPASQGVVGRHPAVGDWAEAAGDDLG